MSEFVFNVQLTDEGHMETGSWLRAKNRARNIWAQGECLSLHLGGTYSPKGTKIVSMIRKYHNHKLQTNPLHREEKPHSNHQIDKQSKAASSLFPIKMIAKLEWTQQNIEHVQNPTMGVAIDNESTTTTTTEPPPKNGRQPKPLGWW